MTLSINLKNCANEQMLAIRTTATKAVGYSFRGYDASRNRIEGSDWHDDDSWDINLHFSEENTEARVVVEEYNTTLCEKQLTRLIRKYVNHIINCEGIHYIDRSGPDGSGLTEEEQKHLYAIMGFTEEEC